jgi:glycosidase
MKVFVGAMALAMFALTVCHGAAPEVKKVEPPNWWVPHTLHPIQLLLTGNDLNGAKVTTASRDFKIETRYASTNGHYLFVYLDIGSQVKPGVYHFKVNNDQGESDFDFRLDRPLETAGRFQGFGPDDVIYLLMPDRFANGDPAHLLPPATNSAAGPRGRHRAGAGYHGGDFRGIRDHLAYLKDLGVTAIWMTPFYRNSGPNGSRGAYHGYSTVDYYDVEPHFGSMQELQALVAAAHKIGIKIIQDQVANHCGPAHPWVLDPPTPSWFNYLDANPKPAIDFNFSVLADPYATPAQTDLILHGWFAGDLPDLNQDDPLVSDYEIQNALWWIGMTGEDGIRQDTYPFVPRSFWERWQRAINRQYPNFVCTAEIEDRLHPDPSGEAVLAFFEGGARRNGFDTGLRSELDFPLEHAVQNVFGANQEPFTKLTDILALDSLFLHPEMLVVFAGNHDQSRMLTVANGDVTKLMMAQTFVLTTRRTAHLYYGDEIAMADGPERGDAAYRDNFPGGFPGNLTNAFTAAGRTGDAAVVFNETRDLLHFRQDHPALRRGDLINLLVTTNQYAYLRSSPEESVLVLLNRAGDTNAVTLTVSDLGLPEGLHFKSFPAGAPDLVVTAGKLILSEPKPINIYWAGRAGLNADSTHP